MHTCSKEQTTTFACLTGLSFELDYNNMFDVAELHCTSINGMQNGIDGIQFLKKQQACLCGCHQCTA